MLGKTFLLKGNIYGELAVNELRGSEGFWGSGEKGYLFSGSWGALLIILGELGSKHILLGIKGALSKSKKKYQASILSNSMKCRWLLRAIAPRPHISM